VHNHIRKVLIPILFDYIPYSWIQSYDKEFAEECQAIADILNVSVGFVAATNFMYETAAFCSGIIAQLPSGVIVHARNMDYHLFPSMVADIIFHGKFYKDGAVLFEGIGLAGTLGILIGFRQEEYTLSLNTRHSLDNKNLVNWIGSGVPGVMKNFYNILWKKRVGVLTAMRRVMENAQNYEDAEKMVMEMQISAPAYFLLSGKRSNEGKIIVRNRERVDKVYQLDVDKGDWYLVQTNYDKETSDPQYDNRRSAAEFRMALLEYENATAENIFQILAQYPSYSSNTLLTVMSASQGEYEVNTTIWYYNEPIY